MEYPDYLNRMLAFKENNGNIIDSDDALFDEITIEWANLIKNQHQKGLIPLFITGCGVSIQAKVPTISNIIEHLEYLFNKKEDKTKLQDVTDLFKTLQGLSANAKRDRAVIARLLNSFQENRELKNEWQLLNKWLLDEILSAKPAIFHKILADIYKNYNAVCLTLNFDGLLIREFVQYRAQNGNDDRAFSLPTNKECESFFLRNPDPKEKGTKNDYLEIQIRGDILYVSCDAVGYCPQKGKGKERSIWASIASYPTGGDKTKGLKSDDLLKCPSCGAQGFSFLSFPGSYDKEKDMQDMLEVVWKYLAYRVGSITVVGMSGEWDPLIIAFLGDLLSERDLPLLVVDNKPEFAYIVRELVLSTSNPSVTFKVEADFFMEKLSTKLSNKPQVNPNDKDHFIEHEIDDKYWNDIIENADDIKSLVNPKLSRIESLIEQKLQTQEKLNNFAQLGLKSYWLGIKPSSSKYQKKYHNRYAHSLGVMKLASYLYDKAMENTGLKGSYKEKQFLRLAALLHDVGHLPFSHLIENVFNELNWKPAGYKGYYSHVFQTDEKIAKLCAMPELEKALSELGYDIGDLIKLVNGQFGVSYLDAIINSPIDADKIDYVFRDTSSTGRNISLSPVQFLRDIVNGMHITPEQYLSFSGISAKAVAELLLTRKYLYKSLYLQPSIIVLEGIVKLIIKTYFVHTLKLNDEEILNKIKPNAKDYPDLGDYKIFYCISKLDELLDEALKSDVKNNLELKIVTLMFEEIKKKKHIFSNLFFENLVKGFDTLIQTNDEDESALKKLESKIFHTRFNGQETEIVEIVRDVVFRMPGSAIIEVSKSPRFLSTANNRREKERSDGTSTFSECILVPDGDFDIWTSNDKATKPIHESALKNVVSGRISVYLYPLSNDVNDSSYKQTVNLFKKLLNKNGIYFERD